MHTKAIIDMVNSKEQVEDMVHDWNTRYFEGETSEELLHAASAIISNIKFL